jgi:mono/diheme cytochrome c family protein
MRILLTNLLLLFVAFGAWAQNPEPYFAEAEGVLQQVRGTMMRELKVALDMKPAEAVALCRHLAPTIKSQIEEETGWEVRRVALRVRDPGNRPNEDERGILLAYVVRSAAGQPTRLLRTESVVDREGRRYVHVMQAIPTFDTCLVCHGPNLDPEVARAVHKLYPDDETTGYSVGDIRGAFSLYKPLPKKDEFESREPGAVKLPARPKPLLERLGYEPKKRTGSIGDAALGAVAFERHCQHCHAPDDLAKQLFRPEAPAAKRELCHFLETHGLTGQPGACDVVAFLQDLALFLADKGQ